MIKKLNITLAIVAIIGALIVGGYWLYTEKFHDITNSRFVHELEGK